MLLRLHRASIRSNVLPRRDGKAVVFEGLIAAVDQLATGLLLQTIEVTKPGGEAGVEGRAGLDLEGLEQGASFDQEVHFVALGVAPEVERRLLARVREGLDPLGDHPIFEDGAAEWMGEELLARRDTQQVTQEPGVVE